MRVALDATPLLGPRTGVGWYTYDLVDAMASASSNDDFALLPISWRTADAVVAPAHANVSVVRRFLPARPVWRSWRWLRWPPVERLVDCDVFHATNYLGPPSRRVPLVVTVHDLNFIRFPNEAPPAIQAMARELPAVLDRAAAVIAVSSFTRDELVDWRPTLQGRVHVVHNGFHARRPPARPVSEAAPYALFIGTLGPRKNLPVLLDAMNRVRAAGVELRLVLVGGREAGFVLPASADGVDERGYVDDDGVAALLAGASVFVFPSKYEGFGLPVLEAMAAGVPVVAADAGAVPEVTSDAAVLVAADDADGFADAIKRVVTDDAVRARLVDAGRRRAREFGWDAAARATLDVYRAVIA